MARARPGRRSRLPNRDSPPPGARHEESKHSLSHADPYAWVEARGIADSLEVEVPLLLIDQVVGQDEAVAEARRAAREGSPLLLLGEPGTGKAMVARAMAQLMPARIRPDVVAHRQPEGSAPRVELLRPGAGDVRVARGTRGAARAAWVVALAGWIGATGLAAAGMAWLAMRPGLRGLLVLGAAVSAALLLAIASHEWLVGRRERGPRTLLAGSAGGAAPFVDATGADAGSLFGGVAPGTGPAGPPLHHRLRLGAAHKAHAGVLFIDDIHTIRLDAQESLARALQERQWPITVARLPGRPPTRTLPIPCHALLVAAGTRDVLESPARGYVGIHPALQALLGVSGRRASMRTTMHDTDANRALILQFSAQETRRQHLPPLSGAAMAEVVREAQRRSASAGRLSLQLAPLARLIGRAGELAASEQAPRTSVDHILDARRMEAARGGGAPADVPAAPGILRPDAQVGDWFGGAMGAVPLGKAGRDGGTLVRVEADAYVMAHRVAGALHVSGGLEREPGIVAGLESVARCMRGHDLAGTQVHIQASGAEAHAWSAGASLAAAVAMVSALERVAVRSDTAFLGDVDGDGRVRGVRGAAAAVEAAGRIGYRRLVVPESVIDKGALAAAARHRIRLVPVARVADAVREGLDGAAGELHVLAQTLGRA